MKIIYIYDGINIYYNNNETFIENIFGIDDNNNLIQNITFQTNLTIDNDNFNNIINLSDKKNIEKGFLLYSYSYEISFAHYLGQTIPKLYDYLHFYKDYKLLIPGHKYNKLCKDILNLLNINEIEIEILKDKTIYEINEFANTPKYETCPSFFTENHLNIYKKIRNPLNIKKNNNPYKLIYLKRDGKPCNDYGNSETGILRKILNENELINELSKLNFDIIVLGDKSILEKKNILNNVKLLITPLGANCMNLIFSNAPKNIIYLSNSENFGENYYTSLCNKLNDEIINYEILRYDGIKSDPLNQWNNSFNVDIFQIIEMIKNII